MLLSPSTFAYSGSYNDAEVHFVDFFQRTEGIKALITNMDKSNIEHAFLMGLPIVKKWSEYEPQAPKYALGDDSPVYFYSKTDDIVLRAVKQSKHHARFYPFITGFNPTDMHAAEQVEQTIKNDPGFWKGIGEILTRHDTLSGLTLDEQARANHPALLKVYKVAAKYNLPVILHSNITSERERKPLYKPELEEALKSSPNTRFIWAHAGSSSTLLDNQSLSFLIDEVRGLLKEYPNLSILASWSLRDIMLQSDSSKQTWVKLINQYPDRFMLGSDVVGKFNNIGTILSKWDEILNALPAENAEKIAKTNMLALMEK